MGIIQVGPVDAVRATAALQRKFAQLSNNGPTLTLAGTLGANAVRQNFQRQQNADGSAWTGLRYRSGTPLNNHGGHMAKGVTFAVGIGQVVVGAGEASAAYNAVHNYGSKKWKSGAVWSSGKFKGQRKYVPQRQFMYIRQEDRRRLMRDLESFIRKQLASQNA